MNPELKDLKVEGLDAEIDSFVACITAAIRHWGRGYEYDYIVGLSGTAFSPAWHESEDCMAWWMEYGNDMRLNFLGKTLGFSIRESPTIFRKEHDEKKELPKDLVRFWERAGAAVRDGKIVLYKTWPVWSIITEWDDDFSRIKLATVENLQSLVAPDTHAKAFILTPGPASFTRMEALKAAIKFGADVADGTFHTTGFSYGGKIYEMILKRMEEEYFCDACKENGCSCVARTMTRIFGTNRDAVNFLNFAGEFMGRQLPQTALEAVIRGYKIIRDMAEGYAQKKLVCDNWNDAPFREEFIEKVQMMHGTHKDTAKFVRRMSDELG